MYKTKLVNKIKNSAYIYKIFETISKNIKYSLVKKNIINTLDLLYTILILNHSEIKKNCQISNASYNAIVRRLLILNTLKLEEDSSTNNITYTSQRKKIYNLSLNSINIYVNKNIVKILTKANNLRKKFQHKKILPAHILLVFFNDKSQLLKKLFFPFIFNFKNFQTGIYASLNIDIQNNKLSKIKVKEKNEFVALKKNLKNNHIHLLQKYLYFLINLNIISNINSKQETLNNPIEDFYYSIKKKIEITKDLNSSLDNLSNIFTYFKNKKNIIKLDRYFNQIEVPKTNIPINQNINPFQIKYNIPWFNNSLLEKFDFFDYGYETYYNQIFKILLKSEEKNVILVGEEGIGKSTFLKKLAKAFLKKKSIVPKVFQDKLIIYINSNFLVSQTNSLDELIKPFNELVEIAKKNHNIFIFIDDIEFYCKSDTEEKVNINLLEPLILSNIRCIATVNDAAYNTYFNSNPLFNSKFEKVIFLEPTTEKTKNILKSIKPKFEKRYNVGIPDEVLEKTCFYCKEYLVESKFPKKAINLLTNACIDVSLIKSSASFLSINLRQQIKLFIVKKSNLDVIKDNLEIKILDDKINVYRALLKLILLIQIRKTFLSDISEKTLNSDVLLNALLKFSVTGSEQIFATMNIDVSNLEHQLQKKVIGQDNAINSIIGAIKRYKIGLKASNKPIGSYFLAGPTGVGKTEFAKALAKLFFNNDNAMMRLDMSEYTMKENISALIGSPPGYIGYEQGGKLTEFVKTNPYSLILFDEMEKANPFIYDILLQVLDEGRLTDGKGSLVDFSKTFIIFTSNIGVKDIDFYCSDNTGKPLDVVKLNLNTNLIKFAQSKIKPLSNFIKNLVPILDQDTTKIENNLATNKYKNQKPKINYDFTTLLLNSKKYNIDALKFITDKELIKKNNNKKINLPTLEQIFDRFDYIARQKRFKTTNIIRKDLHVKTYFQLLIYAGKSILNKAIFSKNINFENFNFGNLKNNFNKNKKLSIKPFEINVKELKNLFKSLKPTQKIFKTLEKIENSLNDKNYFNSNFQENKPTQINLEIHYQNLLKIVKKSLFERFRPEFINRIDEIIVFQRLSMNELKIITLKLLIEFMNNFYNEYTTKIFIDETFITSIAELGYEPKYGARPLKRSLNEVIINKLALFMMNTNIDDASELFISRTDKNDFTCYKTIKTSYQNKLARLKDCQLEFLLESLNISKNTAIKYLNTRYTNILNLPY